MHISKSACLRIKHIGATRKEPRITFFSNQTGAKLLQNRATSQDACLCRCCIRSLISLIFNMIKRSTPSRSFFRKREKGPGSEAIISHCKPQFWFTRDKNVTFWAEFACSPHPVRSNRTSGLAPAHNNDGKPLSCGITLGTRSFESEDC